MTLNKSDQLKCSVSTEQFFLLTTDLRFIFSSLMLYYAENLYHISVIGLATHTC